MVPQIKIHMTSSNPLQSITPINPTTSLPNQAAAQPNMKRLGTVDEINEDELDKGSAAEQ